MKKRKILAALTVVLAAVFNSARAQNFVPNGNFQSTQTQDDLWDGVDGDGYLCCPVRPVTALNDLNRVGEVTVPPSVAVGDLNGDGLPDLVTADTIGFYRVYFNSGTKAEPKFTQGELLPIFLSRQTGREDHSNMVFSAPRVDLTAGTGQGNLDLVVGFYGGVVMIFPNSGSRSVPVFQQPKSTYGNAISTSAQGQIWANLMAPTVYDWNRDGKPDFIVGDGSYSANSIFLLTNQGSATQPKFTEQSRSYLVYGNGRTQMCPTVADYNGDGLPDIITSDRKGDVMVNLNEPGSKPGFPLMKSSVITFAGAASLRTSVTVKAADLNGDGLFDLVFGKANGRVAVAYNLGTKEQPQFGAPEELKGVDLYKNDVLVPTGGCTSDNGIYKGNFNGKVTVVSSQSDPNAQAPSGKNCLRVSYDPPLNKLIPLIPVNTQPAVPKAGGFIWGIFNWTWGGGAEGAQSVNAPCSVRTFAVQFTLKSGVVPGVPYQVSFNVKGQKANGRMAIGLLASGKLSEGKMTRGERGAASFSGDNSSTDIDTQDGTFAVGPKWTTITKSVTFHFKRNELNNPKAWKGVSPIHYEGTIVLQMETEPYDGECYVDNVQLWLNDLKLPGPAFANRPPVFSRFLK